MKYNNIQTQTMSSQGKNNSNTQSEQFSNTMNAKNNKEMAENNSKDLNKRTIRDSEILDQEILSVNDLDNNDIINIQRINNYMSQNLNENNKNNFQKINDNEVSNNIRYEFQKEVNDENKINNTVGSYNNIQDQIIKNKVKLYKEKVYKPFFNKIEKEKKNENKRIQLLNSINDANIKSCLEAQFGVQRGKIYYELSKEQEKINKDIKNYEVQLKLNENEKQKVIEQKNIFFD